MPLIPTLLAIEIINPTKKILREADDIRDFVINKKNTLAGEVKVGFISSLSAYFIKAIGKLLK